MTPSSNHDEHEKPNSDGEQADAPGPEVVGPNGPTYPAPFIPPGTPLSPVADDLKEIPIKKFDPDKDTFDL